MSGHVLFTPALSRRYAIASATLFAATVLEPSLARAEEPAQASATPESNLETVVRSPRDAWQQTMDLHGSTDLDAVESLAASGDVSKIRKGGQGSDIVLRGLQRDNLAVSVDGARIFGACPNRMDPPTSHALDGALESVEVRRGPFDVTSPGALGGSVLFHTRKTGPGVTPDFSLSYGGFGDLRAGASLAYADQIIDAAAGGTFRQANPFESGDGVRFTNIYPSSSVNRYRQEANDSLAYRTGGGWSKVGYAPLPGHHLALAYSRIMVRDAFYPYLLMDATLDDTDSATADYRFDHWKGLREGSVQIFFNHVRHDMSDEGRCSSALAPESCSGVLPEGYGMLTLATSQTFGARMQAILGDSEETTWGDTLLGVDADDRRWDATTTRVLRGTAPLSYTSQASMPEVEMIRVGFFGEHRRRLLPAMRLLAGIRFDVASSSLGIDRSALYKVYFPWTSALSRTDFLVGANARVEYVLLKPLTALLGVGYAERSPDPQERYFALGPLGTKPGTVGNPALASVANTEVDAGLRLRAGALQASAQLFFSRLGRFIVPTTVSGQDGSPAKTFRSVAARMIGGEASGQVPLPLGLSLRASLAYSVGQNLSADSPLPEIPPLQGTVGLKYAWGASFFAEANERWAARQNRVDPSLGESATAAWYVTDLRMGASYQGLQLVLELRNLLDRQYVEHLSYLRDPFASGLRVPEPGRTLLATLRYAL